MTESGDDDGYDASAISGSNGSVAEVDEWSVRSDYTVYSDKVGKISVAYPYGV